MAERHLNVSETELLAALEAMLAPEGEGVRTIEVAHKFNISRGKALAMLKVLEKAGRIEPVRKRIIKFDKYETTTTAYRLKAAKGEQEDDD